MKRLGIIIAVSSALLLGCGKSGGSDKGSGDKSGRSSADKLASAKLDLSKPRDFILHLYRVAKTGDASKWGQQLAKARRARGDKYVKHHLKVWGREIIKYVDQTLGGDPGRLETKLTKGDARSFRLHMWDKNNPETKLSITVSREDGRLVIDEN